WLRQRRARGGEVKGRGGGRRLRQRRARGGEVKGEVEVGGSIEVREGWRGELLSPAKPSIPGVQLHAERAPRVVSQLPSSCPTFSSMPDTPFPLPDEEVWMLDILSHAREFDGSSKGDAAVAEVGDGRGEHGGGVEGSLMVAVVAGDGT
ncbi:hypothetical protein Drorol1_Dr00008386, partial [Drosera rotundifolia]